MPSKMFGHFDIQKIPACIKLACFGNTRLHTECHMREHSSEYLCLVESTQRLQLMCSYASALGSDAGFCNAALAQLLTEGSPPCERSCRRICMPSG